MARMAKLDIDWAIKEMDYFLQVTAQVGYNNQPGSGVFIAGTHMRGAKLRHRSGRTWSSRS